jgi:hypothetical protein
MDEPPFPGQNHVRAARLLEAALLFTFLSHAGAMLSMMLLLPGLPGAAASGVAARAAYVGSHPWIWRLGWLPWQVTALSDLALCVALLRTRWAPRLPAALAIIATVAGIIPDQFGQFQWTWTGTAIARHALVSGEFSDYARFESHIFRLIAGWGAFGYLAGALGWTWCFAAAGVWSKRLTWLSVGAWGAFAVSTAVLFTVNGFDSSHGVLMVVSVGNGVAFVLLMIWLIEVSEAVLRRSRPDADHGLYARWRHPSRGPWPWLCNLLANSRFARSVAHLFPVLAMDSDITGVVYVNYLIEADRLTRFVVAPLMLQRLGPEGRYAMFTFLTFRHGHFGPRCFGPLRRLWPSPIQSNWRIHVYDPATQRRGIQFLTIAVSATRYALAARLLAENVPMHVPAEAEMSRTSDGSIQLRLGPGSGTSPDVQATFRLSAEPTLAPPWDICFGTWRQMLEYCVPQDRAMSAQPWLNRVARQEIDLGIPIDSCRPMLGTVSSKAAEAIAGQAAPLCFLVDKVSFRLLKEDFDLTAKPQGRDISVEDHPGPRCAAPPA